VKAARQLVAEYKNDRIVIQTWNSDLEAVGTGEGNTTSAVSISHLQGMEGASHKAAITSSLVCSTINGILGKGKLSEMREIGKLK